MSKHITQKMALKAIYPLTAAHEEAIVLYHTWDLKNVRPFRQADLLRHVQTAAEALGYTLTPLKEAPHVADTQDQPDSGRLNLSNESPAPFSENYGA